MPAKKDKPKPKTPIERAIHQRRLRIGRMQKSVDEIRKKANADIHRLAVKIDAEELIVYALEQSIKK